MTAKPLESLDNNSPQRDDKGRFITGSAGGARPIGSRPKISEAFLADFHDVWVRKGLKAIDRLADEEPGTFVKVGANLLPKQSELEVTVRRNLFADIDDELTRIRLAREYLASDRAPLLIEASDG